MGAQRAANDPIVFDKTTGALSYDADGSRSMAAAKFAILEREVALTAADCFVV